MQNTLGSNDLKKLGLAFDFAKPVTLIKYFVELAVDDGDIIMDFFSGSATTAQSIFECNLADDGHRHFVLVQLPEPQQGEFQTLCDVGEERIRRAGDKIAAKVAESNKQPKLGEEPKRLPDIGFRVFKLDDSGIDRSEKAPMQVDLVKPGRSDLDIIFEVMLKWGYELTYPVEKTEFAGYECYSVAAGDLICCMKPGLTVDALEAIAAQQPRRVFIMDRVFGANDSLKLNALAIFKHAEEKTQQKIELRTV